MPRRKLVRISFCFCSVYSRAPCFGWRPDALSDRVSDPAARAHITSQLHKHGSEKGNAVLFLLIDHFFYSPPTSKPHHTPLCPPSQNRLSNPQFLAPRSRTSAPRHRPIHPTIGLRPPPILTHKSLRAAFPARRSPSGRPALREHPLGVRGKRIFRR